MLSYALLSLAIVVEVTGTLALRQSAGFSRLWPSTLALTSYAIAFVLLSMVLQRGMAVAVVYALWSAAGILLLTIIGFLVLGETLSSLQLVGIGLLVAGIMLLELGTMLKS
jgi:small multidrug resistance pump